jgi:hypothetical protein
VGYSITVNQAPVDLGIAGMAPITTAPVVVILSEYEFNSLTPTVIATGKISNNGMTAFSEVDAIEAVMADLLASNGKISTTYLPVTNSGLMQPSTPRNFTFTQLSPSSTWTINHNLGYNPPGILIVDSAGDTNEYQSVTFTNTNTLVLTFSSAFSGQAIVG